MNRRHFVFLWAALLLCLPLAGGAQEAELLPADPAVRTGRLANGLTYYIRHNALPARRADFYLAQKVGSVQEEENQRGLAHFLEHMCFNGTRHFPGNTIDTYCERIGVKKGENLNAYTSTDETVYNIDNVPVTPGHVDSMLLILRDWSDGLLLEPEEIDKERGVIHEEWRLSSDAQSRMFERQLPRLYPGSRYAHRYTIGLMSVVDNFKPQELRDYYKKWYRPDLQAVIVVGDVDVDSVEARIKALFSTIKMPANAARYELYPVPDTPQPIYVVDKDPEQSAPDVMLNFKQPTLTRPQRATGLYLLQGFMRQVVCSVLDARLGELSRKAACPFVSAGTGVGNYLMSKTEDAFELDVRPRPGCDTAAVTAALMEVERARRYGLTAGECSRAAADVVSAVERLYDNREKQYNSFYVQQYVRHFLEGDAIPTLSTVYEAYRTFAARLEAADYSRLLAGMTASVDTNFVCLAFYPDKEGVAVPTEGYLREAVERARRAELAPYVDQVRDEPLVPALPRPGRIVSERPADFGYTELRLQNGARVFYRHTDFDESSVQFQAGSSGGLARVEPADLNNARLLPAVVGATGIGRFTATELEKKLAGHQVSLGVTLGAATEGLTGGSTPKDLRTLFELIYLSFGEPAADREGYDNLMAQMRVRLTNAEKDPTTALQDSALATLYDHDARLRPLRLADLERVTYEGVQRVYRQRFAAAGDFCFFFTGNFNEDSLRLYCRQYIGALPRGRREALRDPHIDTHRGVVVNDFTRDMQTPQAYVLEYFDGRTPYSLRGAVAMDFLGQILTKRYDRTIREDAGMAYYCAVDGDMQCGVKQTYALQIQCPVKPAKIDSCRLLIDRGLQQLAREGATDDEMRDVRTFLLKKHADSQRENAYWQSLIAAKTRWGVDVHTGFEETVNSMTSQEVQRMLTDVVLGRGNRVTIVMRPKSLKE